MSWQQAFPTVPPSVLQDAGYGEVFCHPDTAALLLEPGLTVDGREAKATLVGVWPHAHQVRITVPTDGDWWSYGEHCVRIALVPADVVVCPA